MEKIKELYIRTLGRAGPSLGFWSHIEGRAETPRSPPPISGAGVGVCTGPSSLKTKKKIGFPCRKYCFFRSPICGLICGYRLKQSKCLSNINAWWRTSRSKARLLVLTPIAKPMKMNRFAACGDPRAERDPRSRKMTKDEMIECFKSAPEGSRHERILWTARKIA